MVTKGRCGFQRSEASDIMCWRETWRDHESCIWHADTDDKPLKELSEARNGFPERLDGAILRNVVLDTKLSFENCCLDGSDFRNATIRKISFRNASIQEAEFGQASTGVSGRSGQNRPEIGADVETLEETMLISSCVFDRADISRSNFSGVKFTHVSFEETQAHAADFSNSQLIETELPPLLEEATLQKIDQAGADLSDHQLDGADFSYANLSGAILPANMDRVTFEGCMLNGITTGDRGLYVHNPNLKFTSVELTGALLCGADLRGLTADGLDGRALTATGSWFRGGTFKNCDFEDAYLNGTDVSHVDFSQNNGLLVLDFENANLSRTNFSGCSIPHVSFDGSTGEDVDFSEANISGGTFRKAILTNADFSETKASRTNFNHASLERSRFTEAELFDSSFVGAQLYATKFAGVQLGGEIDFGSKSVYDPSSSDKDALRQRFWNRLSVNTDQDEGQTTQDSVSSETQLRKAIVTYHTLETLCRNHGLPELEADYFVRRQEMQRLQHHAEKRYIRAIRALLSKKILLYGESPERLILTSFSIICTAALLYPLGGWLNRNGDPIEYPGTVMTDSPVVLSEYVNVFVDSFYFSVLTFLTLGFGDIQVSGFGRWIAVTQTALGALLLALLVYVYGRRASR